FLYLLAVSFMFTHEMDAIRRHEWRVFPLADRLPDETGFLVFVLLHVPGFALVMWLSIPLDANVATPFQIAFSIFCIVHVGLHKLLERRLAFEFNNPLSQLLIWGSGVFGLGHLISAFG
ncbi:MAG: DUF6713 family protein, partial [Hyphomicrobiaceae bacterium]